jgi:RNA polymerase sigma factor (sigma-70 family)
VQDSDTADFTACWQRDVPRVLAYATRHVGHETAPEIVAETFLQAWRRWEEIPEQPLPWLLSTARKTIANQRRSTRRRVALQDRIATLERIARVPDVGEMVEARAEALTALAGLPNTEREALLLVVWDGLTADQAATALGIRPGALRVRLHRARRRLSAGLEAGTQGPNSPPVQTVTNRPEESPCLPPR